MVEFLTEWDKYVLVNYLAWDQYEDAVYGRFRTMAIKEKIAWFARKGIPIEIANQIKSGAEPDVLIIRGIKITHAEIESWEKQTPQLKVSK